MNFSDRFSSSNSASSFTQQLAHKNTLVYQLNFPVNGKTMWYVLKVEKAKHKAFRHQMTQAAPIALRDYGAILHSGWGDEPNAALKAKLTQEYGLYS